MKLMKRIGDNVKIGKDIFIADCFGDNLEQIILDTIITKTIRVFLLNV
jgi:hypothetical protein